MGASGDRGWPWRAVFVGTVYLVVGLAFGALAGGAASAQSRTGWRLAAWLVSAVAFAAHVWYERLRSRASTRASAARAAAGAALGAFALAAAANVHSWTTGAGTRPLLLVALLAWPAVTALPAFVVALAGAALLGRRTPR